MKTFEHLKDVKSSNRRAAQMKATKDSAHSILDQGLPTAALEVKRLKLANGDITVVDDNATGDQLQEVIPEAGLSIDRWLLEL